MFSYNFHYPLNCHIKNDKNDDKLTEFLQVFSASSVYLRS